jgi:Bacteriophage abortive infection AbiH
MNIYILGNGFDLDLGFDTSYSSFIKSNQFKRLCSNSSNNQLAKHIEKEFNNNNALWLDLETTIGTYANEFSKDKQDDLNHYLEELKLMLKTYLARQETINNNQESSRAFSFLRYIADDLQKNRNVTLINFNYTDSPLDRLKFLMPNGRLDVTNFEYIHPHGEISKEIVLGVNDDFLDERGSQYFFIKKGHSKLYNISSWKNKYSSATNIKIFGHSLGITDSDVFIPMFNYFLGDAPSGISIEIYDQKHNELRVSEKIDQLVSGKIGAFKLQNSLKINPDL